MANDANTQQALALEPRFHVRVRAALAKVAFQVLEEGTGVANHTIRANYARNVTQNLSARVTEITPWLVMRPNLFAAVTTSYDYAANAHVTTATDAAIESQISTDWNFLAGV